MWILAYLSYFKILLCRISLGSWFYHIIMNVLVLVAWNIDGCYGYLNVAVSDRVAKNSRLGPSRRADES